MVKNATQVLGDFNRPAARTNRASRHYAKNVIDLQFNGESRSIETTDNHPCIVQDIPLVACYTCAKTIGRETQRMSNELTVVNSHDGDGRMKRAATVISLLWVLLFVVSGLWLNDSPTTRGLFIDVPLREAVSFGFPVSYAEVRFPVDHLRDEPYSRFLHDNLDRMKLVSHRAWLINLALLLIPAVCGFLGMRRVCQDSRLVGALSRVAWMLAAIAAGGLIAFLQLAGRHVFPLVDTVAKLMGVLWFAFTVVTIKQAIEVLTSAPDERLEETVQRGARE